MNEKEMFARYKDVVVAATKEGKTYMLILSPLAVTTLHGAVALTMTHPQVKEKLKYAQLTLAEIRKKLCEALRQMGFTQEEVKYLDTKEV